MKITLEQPGTRKNGRRPWVCTRETDDGVKLHDGARYKVIVDDYGWVVGAMVCSDKTHLQDVVNYIMKRMTRTAAFDIVE